MSKIADHEQATIDMCNLLKTKEIVPIIISGSTQNGTYILDLRPPINLNKNATHKVYLQSFTGWSNIKNIITNVNDNFTYRNTAGTTKTFIFPAGAYQLDDIYSEIYKQMANNTDANTSTNPTSYYINFSTNLPTQQVVININNSFKVDFTPINSIASILGFDNTLLSGNSGTTVSTEFKSNKLVNIMNSQSINITCNIVNGYNNNGVVSNILYSFSNNIPRGMMIDIMPNPIVPCLCNTKNIQSISISFQDENGSKINFNGERFTIRMVIEQM